MSQKEYWDKVASHYQKIIFTEDENDYPQAVMNFLGEKKALEPDSWIADVGCGAGKYAIRFAKARCSLLLTDLSTAMLDYAMQNTKQFPVDIVLKECDFSETDVEKEGWKKQFDLAFSNMSPAIDGRETILKLSSMSRKHCFVSKFARLENQLQKTVLDSLHMKGMRDLPKEQGYMELAVAVYEAGYLPELCYKDYNWYNEYTIDGAVSYLFGDNRLPLEDTPVNRKKVEQAVRPLSDKDGKVRENVFATAAWIYWDVARGLEKQMK